MIVILLIMRTMVSRREKLPLRRGAITETFSHDGVRYHVTYGFYNNGRVGETFIKAGKPNSPIDRLCSDISVILSIWIQNGMAADEIIPSLQVTEFGEFAGAIGIVLNRISELEKEHEKISASNTSGNNPRRGEPDEGEAETDASPDS